MLARLLAPPFALANPASQQGRRLGLVAVVNWLEAQPAGNWQARWLASGAENCGDWRELISAGKAGRAGTSAGPSRPVPHAGAGLLVLIGADVIRPGIGWLLRCPSAPRNLAAEMARIRDPTAFAELAALCQSGSAGSYGQLAALSKIAVIIAAKGGMVAGITVGDCVQLLEIAVGARTGTDQHASSPFFYQLLRARDTFGPDAPAAMRVFSSRGQPTCEQLIDRYRIASGPVRDVLVDYLRERQLSADFSSLQNLAYLLGKLFWADLEAHHPGIDSLKLSRDVAAAWKQRVMSRAKTAAADDRGVPAVTARLNGRSVLTAVRAFYLDIAEWADDDPARWGPHAVRCPVSASDASHKKDRSQRKSRMDQRTRERLPVLPALAAWADDQRTAAALRLQAAAGTAAGAPFSAGGQTLLRPVMKTETTGRIWAEDPATGKRRDLTFEEHRGFWCWAMVEVLRHTGIRIEELTELSHHSLIQYRLPGTGELIPLLQITPSKTDAERLLVISPELADVLSAIMRRIRRAGPDVPLVVAYDKNERVYNPPMPLLFQHRRLLEDRPVSETALRGYLDHALASIGVKDAGGRPLRYTFHDFRTAFHHRRDHARDAAAHRPARRRAPRHQHHDGLQGRLPRGSHQRPPRVHRPPPVPAPITGIPRAHRRGMGRVHRPLRTPPGRSRRLRPLLRHPLHPRARMPALPAAAPRPRPAFPPGPDLRQPRRPHRRSRNSPLARRGRGPENQPRQRQEQARPDGPDHRSPQHRHQPRHASLRQRRQPHRHHPESLRPARHTP